MNNNNKNVSKCKNITKFIYYSSYIVYKHKHTHTELIGIIWFPFSLLACLFVDCYSQKMMIWCVSACLMMIIIIWYKWSWYLINNRLLIFCSEKNKNQILSKKNFFHRNCKKKFKILVLFFIGFWIYAE